MKHISNDINLDTTAITNINTKEHIKIAQRIDMLNIGKK